MSEPKGPFDVAIKVLEKAIEVEGIRPMYRAIRVLEVAGRVDKTRALGGLTWLENTAGKIHFTPSWFRMAIPSTRVLLESLPEPDKEKK